MLKLDNITDKLANIRNSIAVQALKDRPLGLTELSNRITLFIRIIYTLRTFDNYNLEHAAGLARFLLFMLFQQDKVSICGDYIESTGDAQSLRIYLDTHRIPENEIYRTKSSTIELKNVPEDKYVYINSNLKIKCNTNTIYLEKYPKNIRKNNKSLLNVISLLGEHIQNLLTDELIDEITTLHWADSIPSIKSMDDVICLDYMKIPLQTLKMDNLVKHITNYQKNYLQKTVNELDNELYEITKNYKEKLESRNHHATLLALNNFDSGQRFINMINNLKESGDIKEASIEGSGDCDYSTTFCVKILWNMLPILYYNEDTLRISINNIASNKDQEEALNGLSEGRYELYTLPLATIIKISNGTIEFTTTDLTAAREKLGKIVGYNMLHSARNFHVLHSAGRGCKGTFALQMQKAQSEFRLDNLLVLIKQFYQSLTVGDPLGNQILRGGIYVNKETGDILNWYSREDGTLLNIKDIRERVLEEDEN